MGACRAPQRPQESTELNSEAHWQKKEDALSKRRLRGSHHGTTQLPRKEPEAALCQVTTKPGMATAPAWRGRAHESRLTCPPAQSDQQNLIMGNIQQTKGQPAQQLACADRGHSGQRWSRGRPTHHGSGSVPSLELPTATACSRGAWEAETMAQDGLPAPRAGLQQYVPGS